LISTFRRVLNVVCFLLGNSPASEFYMPTFRNTLLHLHRQADTTLQSLFLYSNPHPPCHPPSYWLRLFSSQAFSRINTPKFLKPNHSSYLPAYEDGTECSETSAYKIQTQGNYPEESIKHCVFLLVEHRLFLCSCYCYVQTNITESVVRPIGDTLLGTETTGA
jgi:hypothetical protein